MKSHTYEKAFVVVTYNSQNFIELCLESIVRYSKIDQCAVVVVDNGSTDDTIKIVTNFYAASFWDYFLIKIFFLPRKSARFQKTQFYWIEYTQLWQG